MHEVCFDRRSRYVSAVLEVCFNVLELCFDCARSMFLPSSRYVSIEIEVCFDRARDMFRSSSRYVSTDLR